MESEVDDAEIAGRGRPGEQADNLLHRAMRLGIQTLAEIANTAIRRLVGNGKNYATVERLFTRAELDELARALAATNATSNLLGRSHIRRRLQLVKRRVSESREVMEKGGDVDVGGLDRAGPKPLVPERAVSYFRRLVPSLDKDPQRFGELFRREAFTLAIATDTELLSRVKSLIQDRLETGVDFGKAPKEIDALLNDAGVSPTNSQYSQLVFRTNAADSYNQGAEEELRDPDVATMFPTWEYQGIQDGRQGEDHEVNFGKYYRNGTSFADVRGPRVFNCRCSFRPIDKYEWADLEKNGATVER